MNVGFLVAAVIVAVPAAVWAHPVVKVRRWHKAQGVVLSAELLNVRFSGRRGTSLRPVIRYRYTVNGTVHDSDVYSLALQSGGVDESWAQQILDRYPPGTPVTVRHDPAEPGRACLSAGFGIMGWALTALSCLLLLLGLVF